MPLLAPLHSAPNLLVADTRVWGTFLLGVAFRHVICGFYIFFLPVRLPSEIQKLPPDPLVRGFPSVWKLPLITLPSWDGSPSLTLLSLFLSFIFCPTSFWRQWAAFLGVWCPLLAIRSCFVEFAQHSNYLLMNLWERKWSPHPIPLPFSSRPAQFCQWILPILFINVLPVSRTVSDTKYVPNICIGKMATDFPGFISLILDDLNTLPCNVSFHWLLCHCILYFLIFLASESLEYWCLLFYQRL